MSPGRYHDAERRLVVARRAEETSVSLGKAWEYHVTGIPPLLSILPNLPLCCLVVFKDVTYAENILGAIGTIRIPVTKLGTNFGDLRAQLRQTRTC